MHAPRLTFRRLDPDLPPPRRTHDDDAGLDLRARVDVQLPPDGGRRTVPTGIAVDIPADHVGFLVARSGIAAEHGITVLNAPGIIDAGYRGEVIVILVNLGDRAYPVRRGDRIAQLVVVPTLNHPWEEKAELSPSRRGPKGLGDSGRR